MLHRQAKAEIEILSSVNPDGLRDYLRVKIGEYFEQMSQWDGEQEEVEGWQGGEEGGEG